MKQHQIEELIKSIRLNLIEMDLQTNVISKEEYRDFIKKTLKLCDKLQEILA